MFRYKQFIAGAVAGALIIGSIQAGTAVSEYILTKAKYRMVVEGQEYNDDKLPMLNYKGSTYIPLKKAGDLLGAVVKWNNEDGQVEITKPSQKPTQPKKTPTPAPTATSTPAPTPQEEIKVLKLGETAVYKGLELKVTGMDNTAKHKKEGLDIGFCLINNSGDTLKSMPLKFQFTLENPLYQEEINKLAPTPNTNNNKGYVYPKEKFEGSYDIYYKREYPEDINVKEVSCTVATLNGNVTLPFKWIIE